MEDFNNKMQLTDLGAHGIILDPSYIEISEKASVVPKKKQKKRILQVNREWYPSIVEIHEKGSHKEKAKGLIKKKLKEFKI